METLAKMQGMLVRRQQKTMFLFMLSKKQQTLTPMIANKFTGRSACRVTSLQRISASETRTGSKLEPPEKRPKPAERRNDDNEVIIVDNAEFQESAKTQGEDELVSDKDASLYGACM